MPDGLMITDAAPRVSALLSTLIPGGVVGSVVADEVFAGSGAKLPLIWRRRSLALALICERADGVPSGLVNVLAGAGPTTGAAAVAHAGTRLVVFVGSAETGAQIAAAAARNIVPSVLELSGKSANILFADADLSRVILATQAAIFGGAGRGEFRSACRATRSPRSARSTTGANSTRLPPWSRTPWLPDRNWRRAAAARVHWRAPLTAEIGRLTGGDCQSLQWRYGSGALKATDLIGRERQRNRRGRGVLRRHDG